MDIKFEDLPIIVQDYEKNGEWTRTVKRQTTIAELLKNWDIDDPNEMTEMAQVLRHLRDYMSKNG